MQKTESIELPKIAYSVDEWCEVSPMSRKTAYAEIADGELRSFKVRNRRFIPRTEREDYIQRKLAKQHSPDAA